MSPLTYRSVAIDHLKITKTSKVVYIYFDYKAEKSQTCIAITKSLVKQLVSQFSDIPFKLTSLYENSTRADATPNLTQWVDLLADWSKENTIYVVFDAMDECSDDHQNEVLRLFITLQQLHYKLLISTRPHIHNHLQRQLGDISTLQVVANDSDLGKYVISRLKNEDCNNENLKLKCLELVSKVGGM